MTPEHGDGGLPGPPGPSLIPMTGFPGGNSLNRLVQNIRTLRPCRPLRSLPLVEKQGERLASLTPGHTPHGSWRSPPARVLVLGKSLKSCRSGICLPRPIPALQPHSAHSNSGTVAAGQSWAPIPAPPLPVSGHRGVVSFLTSAFSPVKWG